MRIRRSLRRIVANLVDAHSEEQQCVVLLSIECDLARDLGALGQCERVIGVCYIVVQRFADEEVEQPITRIGVRCRCLCLSFALFERAADISSSFRRHQA